MPAPEAREDGLEVDGRFLVAETVKAGPLEPPAALWGPLPADPNDALGVLEEARLRVEFDGGFSAVVPWLEYGSTFRSVVIPGPIPCAAMAALGTGSPNDLQLFYGLGECGDPDHAEAMRSQPPELQAHWAVNLHSRGYPIPDFVWDSAPELARQLGPDNDLVDLLNTLETDRPDLVESLVATARALGPETRTFGSAIGLQQDRRLSPWRQPTEAPDVLANPELAARTPGIDLVSLLRRYPAQRTTLLGAVERCASDPTEERAPHCLYSLATADWERAQAVARKRPAAFDMGTRALVETLKRFSGPQALSTHLDGLGFPAADRDYVYVGTPFVTVEDALTQRGLAIDSNDRSFAGTAGFVGRRLPELNDVRFEQIDPPGNYFDGGIGFLRAWEGTARHHVLLRSGWYVETDTIAGLLNRLLIDKESAMRASPIAGSGVLVVGPASGLESLMDDGLLPWDPP